MELPQSRVKITKLSSIVFKSWKAKDFIPDDRLRAVGLAESGEFTEVVKKIVFQGKPVNEDNIFHLKRELRCDVVSRTVYRPLGHNH